MGIRKYWLNLPVSTKLFSVVGAMTFIIVFELTGLIFVLDSLTAVGGVVSSESLWSKAQKDAVINLYNYARTENPRYFTKFIDNMMIPMGQKKARMAFEMNPPDFQAATEGFIQGGIHPDDAPGIVKVIRILWWIKGDAKTIFFWRNADRYIDRLLEEGSHLHRLIRTHSSKKKINKALIRLEKLNNKLTVIEKQFSYYWSGGARKLKFSSLVSLLFVVGIIQSIGLYLIWALSRNLTRGLRELNSAATKVGKGNFDIHVPVKSGDELGKLTQTLNDMVQDLKNSIVERRMAERANKFKSQFLANMSHEIRTPLGAIMGFSELLKDKKLSSSERSLYADIIHRTGENLTWIINDILDLSKVEAGHLEINHQPFLLRDLLNELQSLLMPKCAKKSLHMRFLRVGDVPQVIVTDPIRLRQILLNILSNAIKFSRDEGKIEMFYEVRGDQIIFRIKDHGLGIPEDKIPLLFKAFTQLDESKTRQHEGTGLGLALSKKLAQMLNGSLDLVETAVNKGSVFELKIKLKKFEGSNIQASDPKAPIAVKDYTLEGKKILLVDDVEENRLLLQRMLSKRGAEVCLAVNGEEAIRLALTTTFDVILMDIQMPIMDGYSATQSLRQAGYWRPIIALTAHAMKDDREKCLEVGCSDYLTKPVQLNQLVRAINSQTNKTASICQNSN